MRKSIGFIAAAVLALGAGGAMLGADVARAEAEDGVAVTYGDDPELDACPSMGQANGEVTVYTGPGDGYGEYDTLVAGQAFHICAWAEDGAWFGIVYAPTDDPDKDCGVNRNVAGKTDYDGECWSGWVEASTVEVTAG